MDINVQITLNYKLQEDELIRFKERCLEYANDRCDECPINSVDDISDEAVELTISSCLPDILESRRLGCSGGGVILDDYFNSISFDFSEEDAQILVEECVEHILEH